MCTICTRILVHYLEGQGHSMTLKQNHVRPITLLFDVGFKTISQKWSPYWDNLLRARFWSLLWRSRSQHTLQQNRVRPIIWLLCLPLLGKTYCFCLVRLSVCPSVTPRFRSITRVPFDPEPSNFKGWLLLLSWRTRLILGSVGQRSR